MPAEGNRCFGGLVISGAELGEGGGREVEGCYVHCQKESDLWLDVEEETTISNDGIDCHFEPFRYHTFMTARKKWPILWPTLLNSCDPALPSAKMNNRSFV